MRLFAAVPLFGTGAAASSAGSSRGSTVEANGAGFGTQGYGDGPYGDPEGRTVWDYANDKGIVDTAGLLDAIDDWRADGIDTTLLLDVIDAWRSGDKVN